MFPIFAVGRVLIWVKNKGRLERIMAILYKIRFAVMLQRRVLGRFSADR